MQQQAQRVSCGGNSKQRHTRVQRRWLHVSIFPARDDARQPAPRTYVRKATIVCYSALPGGANAR
jgi:hypothetical protein